MEGLASHLAIALAKVVVCNAIDVHEPLYKILINIVILSAFLVTPVTTMANMAFWVFNRLTPRSDLPLKRANMVMKLALALGIFLRERTRETKIARALCACPWDIADFSLELAVYMIALDLMLVIVAVISRMTGPRDQRAVAVTFVVILVLGLTWFNGVTQEAFKYLLAVLRDSMTLAAGKLYGQDWILNIIDTGRSYSKNVPRNTMR